MRFFSKSSFALKIPIADDDAVIHIRAARLTEC